MVLTNLILILELIPLNKRVLLLFTFILPSLLLFGCGSKVQGIDKNLYEQGKSYAQMMKNAMNGDNSQYEKHESDISKYYRQDAKDNENLFTLFHTINAMQVFVHDHNIFGGENGKKGFSEAEKILKEKLNIELE